MVEGTNLGVPVKETPVESVARSTVVEGTRLGKLEVVMSEFAIGSLLTVVTASTSIIFGEDLILTRVQVLFSLSCSREQVYWTRLVPYGRRTVGWQQTDDEATMYYTHRLLSAYIDGAFGFLHTPVDVRLPHYSTAGEANREDALFLTGSSMLMLNTFPCTGGRSTASSSVHARDMPMLHETAGDDNISLGLVQSRHVRAVRVLLNLR